jgi:hypothetical protein
MDHTSSDHPRSRTRQDEVWTDADGAAMFHDRDGMPMTLRQFSNAFNDVSYKIVARTEVGDHVVTTAWLGTDQGHGDGSGPPLIFGTIVQRDGVFDQTSERFAATEHDAYATHTAVVEACGRA